MALMTEDQQRSRGAEMSLLTGRDGIPHGATFQWPALRER